MAQKKEQYEIIPFQTSHLIVILKALAHIIALIEKKDEKEVLKDLYELQNQTYQALISSSVSTRSSRH